MFRLLHGITRAAAAELSAFSAAKRALSFVDRSGFTAKPPRPSVRVRRTLRYGKGYRLRLSGDDVVVSVNQLDRYLVLAGRKVGDVDGVAVARIRPHKFQTSKKGELM